MEFECLKCCFLFSFASDYTHELCLRVDVMGLQIFVTHWTAWTYTFPDSEKLRFCLLENQRLAWFKKTKEFVAFNCNPLFQSISPLTQENLVGGLPKINICRLSGCTHFVLVIRYF